MIITYKDKNNLLPVPIETDGVYYITYNESLKRAIVYYENSLTSFNIELGNLLLPIVGNKVINLAYCVDYKGTHYLVNVHKLVSFGMDSSGSTVEFNNKVKLNIGSTYLYGAIQSIRKYYESQNSGEIHTSSEGNS